MVAGAGGGGAQGWFFFLPLCHWAIANARFSTLGGRPMFLFCLSNLPRPATARPATPASPSLYCKRVWLGWGDICGKVGCGGFFVCVCCVEWPPIFLSPFLTLGGRHVFLLCLPQLPPPLPPPALPRQPRNHCTVNDELCTCGWCVCDGRRLGAVGFVLLSRGRGEFSCLGCRAANPGPTLSPGGGPLHRFFAAMKIQCPRGPYLF